ncbi:MAG: hypothetical protein R3Y47_10135 [Lachnospiraceae bacterium]
MQKYKNEKLIAITCNQCGKELKIEQGYCVEGMVQVNHTFGYFTRKDGTCHSFDLCEDCYDLLVEKFKIPVTVGEKWDFD